MKKILWKLLFGVTMFCLMISTGCSFGNLFGTSNSAEDSSLSAGDPTSIDSSFIGGGDSSSGACEHQLVKMAKKEPTCAFDGNIEYYLCWKCNHYYLDETGETETSEEDVILSALEHELSKTEAVTETCSSDGNVAYYACPNCEKYFEDEAATKEIAEENLVIRGGHTFTKVDATPATCTADGNIEYYVCGRCDKYYIETSSDTEIAKEDTVLSAFGHAIVKKDATEATCVTDGNAECYYCEQCDTYFAEEEGETVLDKSTVLFPGAHELTYHAASEPEGKQNGNIEHWYCSVCEKYFTDEACENEEALENVIIFSLFNIPDFLVEVESGRDPVVLQLSDPQIMYEADVESRSNRYIAETIEAVKPDLILVTGDLTYGKFDTASGTIFTQYVNFMESFEIPWAPVFGNHDNECPKGVDWQCAQLENAEYCLFKQGDVTGNGNYSVGIEQGGKLLRVFYMLDSNGCGEPSAASKGKVKESAGFAQDQIDWYTNEIRAIHHKDPNVKISFAYHIQQAIFGRAFQKYAEYDGKVSSSTTLANPLNLDRMETADDTDFGYLGRTMKGAWDTDLSVWNGMKALGVDSIFVGHEHCNSVSIVYEGVRFQYGQKSSSYDRYNWVFEDGRIEGGYTMPTDAHPLLGGTVIPISSEDGSIGTGYIYYCGNPFDF